MMGKMCVAVVVMVMGLSAVLANADVIVSHSGTQDPVNEGWTQKAAGTYTIFGKSNDDDGVRTDVACFHISSPNNGYCYYEANIAAADLSKGWKYTLDMRSWDTTGIFGTFFQVDDGSNSWSVLFNGNNTISLWMQGQSQYNQVVKSDANLNLYSVYQLYHNPTIDPNMVYLTMDNGQTHLASWARSAAPVTTAMSVYWGDGSSGAVSNMRVAGVTFETVPEPATVVILLAAGCGAMIRRRK